MNIILMGCPGAGKGTQSAKLLKEFPLHHISTGDVLRAEMASGSDLGKKLGEIVNQGNLVPDELMVQMLENIVKSTDKGIIFDGFPRTVAQAEALDQMMQRLGRANVRGYMANVLGTVERAGLVRSVNMHETLRNAGLVSANQFGEVSSPAFAERVLLGETSVAQLTGMDMEKYVFSGFTSQLLEGTVVPSTAQLQTELDMLTRYMKETRVVGGDVIKHFAPRRKFPILISLAIGS